MPRATRASVSSPVRIQRSTVTAARAAPTPNSAAAVMTVATPVTCGEEGHGPCHDKGRQRPQPVLPRVDLFFRWILRRAGALVRASRLPIPMATPSAARLAAPMISTTDAARSPQATLATTANVVMMRSLAPASAQAGVHRPPPPCAPARRATRFPDASAASQSARWARCVRLSTWSSPGSDIQGRRAPAR